MNLHNLKKSLNIFAGIDLSIICPGALVLTLDYRLTNQIYSVDLYLQEEEVHCNVATKRKTLWTERTRSKQRGKKKKTLRQNEEGTPKRTIPMFEENNQGTARNQRLGSCFNTFSLKLALRKRLFLNLSDDFVFKQDCFLSHQRLISNGVQSGRQAS